MTHTAEDCPGYNPEKMPDTIAALGKIGAVAKELNIKCHFWVQGAPEHVAYALIEADNRGAVSRFVHYSVPFRQDFKVTLVQHTQDLLEKAKAMMQQQ